MFFETLPRQPAQEHQRQAWTTPGLPLPNLWHRPEMVGETSSVGSQCEPFGSKGHPHEVAGNKCRATSGRKGPTTVPAVSFLSVRQRQAGQAPCAVSLSFKMILINVLFKFLNNINVY